MIEPVHGFLENPDKTGFCHSEDPIVAIASPSGVSAIGIIRVSGAGLKELFAPLIRFKSSKALEWPKPRQMTYLSVIDPDKSTILDDVMLCYYSAPHTYTGEDMVEIFPHGSPYVMSSLLKLLLAKGCRQADAGEFSRRAFLNGKIDLAAAEGIRGMTEAESEGQWLAARQMASGKLSEYINDLRDQVIRCMAFLEARIDFPDEGDTKDVGLDQVNELATIVSESLTRLMDSFQSGRVSADGFRVALLGSPNVGKSTLMNAFLGHERAIVTDIPGTTRDYLEEKCLLNGRLIRLIDTAGLRTTEDTIEKIGIERSLEIAQEADLVLFITDTGENNEEAEDVLRKLRASHTPFFEVWSKCDLRATSDSNPDALQISAKNGIGLERLKEVIVSQVDNAIGVGYQSGHVVISNARHQAAIHAARASMSSFFQLMNERSFDECLAFELREAADALESIVGRVEQDDVFDVIFSSFCVGK